MWAIVDKADRLIALHAPRGHDACAVIAVEEDQDALELVAATQSARRKKVRILVSKQPQQQQESLGQRVDSHLVDTGSMFLIMPWMSEKAQACLVQAGAASPAQQWTILLALVSFPIIGPDLSIFTEIMDSWRYPLRKNLLKGPSRQIGFP
jgi:hypothetical protein